MISETLKNVRVNKIGPKLIEIEPSRFFGGVWDCIKVIPEIQEKENVKAIFRVGQRIYLVLE